MKEYLTVLLSAAAALSIALAVSHNALRGAVRAALGLVLLLSLVAPLTGIFSELISPSVPDVPTLDGSSDFENITTVAFEEGIAGALVERWGEAVRGCSVICRGFSVSDMLAESISVALPRSAVNIDYREIRDFVSENFTRGGYCEVYYG